MDAIKTVKPCRPFVGHQDANQKNPRIQLAIRLTDYQFGEIVRRADKSRRSAAAVVRELIDNALRRK